MSMMGLGGLTIGNGQMCPRCYQLGCQCHLYSSQVVSSDLMNRFLNPNEAAASLMISSSGLGQVVTTEPSINQLLLLLE